jgi:hypothetical protein
MSRILRSRPSPGLVIACIALFISMGGVSYGLAGSRGVKADDLGTRSVGKRAIRAGGVGKSEAGRRSIGRSELRNNTVNGAEVADDTLGGDDIDESTLGAVPNANNLGGVPPSGYLTSETRTFQANSASNLNYGDDATLVTLNVPAGQYSVVAKTSIDNDTAADETITCTLNGPNADDDSSTNRLGDDTAESAAEELTYAMVDVFTSTAATALTVSCEQQGADNDASNTKIVATNVG